jgi:hypothetical protein
MSVKLGIGDVSFRLGAATPAAVFLGSAQVWAATRTLYYNDGEVDGDWGNLANWWNDAAHTNPAESLPASVDNVVLSGYVNSNSSGAVTVANLTMPSNESVFILLISLTVTGMATFNSNTGLGVSATLTGNATFNGSACKSGTVTGAVTGSPDACP